MRHPGGRGCGILQCRRPAVACRCPHHTAVAGGCGRPIFGHTPRHSHQRERGWLACGRSCRILARSWMGGGFRKPGGGRGSVAPISHDTPTPAPLAKAGPPAAWSHGGRLAPPTPACSEWSECRVVRRRRRLGAAPRSQGVGVRWARELAGRSRAVATLRTGVRHHQPALLPSTRGGRSRVARQPPKWAPHAAAVVAFWPAGRAPH